MTDERIVAVGLLTEENVGTLGSSLKKVFRIDETPCFTELLRALDEADRERREREPGGAPGPQDKGDVAGS
jgi:hypothetical protein